MPPFLTLFLVLVVVGAVVAAITTFLMAWALLHPPRMNDGRALAVLQRLSPDDLNLTYFSISFTVRDVQTASPLRLAAWWMPHPTPTERCVMLIHGYSDAKVGSIAWAPMWQALGFNVLAIDLRAHGESEGTICTGGVAEQHDVAAVIDQIRARWPDQTRQVVLFGISLGASVALGAASLRGGADAIVLESPFADYREAAMTHMSLVGLPGSLFQKVAIWIAERICGGDLSRARPIDRLADLNAPILIIAPSADFFLPPAASAQMEQALLARGNALDAFWRIEALGHVEGAIADPAGYQHRLQAFIESALVKNSPSWRPDRPFYPIKQARMRPVLGRV